MSRRKSTFIPPGFANSFSKLEDAAAGVTFQNGYESFSAFQPPKVLRYDAHAVLAELAPWRALLSRTRHATALRFGDFLWKLGYCTAIALVVASLSGGLHLVDKGTAEAVASLNMMVAGGLFFLLAPFVSTATARRVVDSPIPRSRNSYETKDRTRCSCRATPWPRPRAGTKIRKKSARRRAWRRFSTRPGSWNCRESIDDTTKFTGVARTKASTSNH